MSSPIVQRARLINELASMNLPGHVAALLPLVFGDDAVVARAAAAALERCLDAAPAAALPALEVEWRRVSWWSPTPTPWARLKAADIPRLWTFDDAYVAVLAAASFHASGWVREAAVERLDAVADPDALRWLLLRMNDWVDEVATRARAAVERRLDAAHAGLLLDHFALVARMEHGTRRDAGDLATRVRSLLREQAPVAVLEGGLRSSARETRRLALSLLLERPDTDRLRTLTVALEDRDVVVRSLALRLAVTRLDPASLGRVMGTLVRDPFPGIRRDALAHAVTHLGDRAVPWLEAALLDASESVRDVAHFGVRRLLPCTDLRALHRDFVARARASGSASELAIALAGLAATGNAHDAGFVQPFVAHERPRVRAAALRALQRLARDEAHEPLVAALEDPSPSVSRAARLLLRGDAARVGADRIASLLDASRPGHVRANALLLGAQLPKWDVPPLLLLMASDAALGPAARRALAGWSQRYNRTFTPPTPPQLERLRGALARFGSTLDRRERAELEAIARGW